MRVTGIQKQRTDRGISRRKFLGRTAAALGAVAWPIPGSGAPARSLTSEVRRRDGKPALFLNGRRTSLITAFAGRPEDIPDLVEAGFTVFDIVVPIGWVGPERYDYTQTDAAMDSFLSQSNRILILPRMEVAPGGWWSERFPDELSRRADGTPAQFRGGSHPSFASREYRRLALPAIAGYVRHLERKYGGRIVGYFVCNGVYGEWLSWNSYWEVDPGDPPPAPFGVEDYSTPAREAFRGWLRRKYRGSVTRLQQAWGDPQVTFDTATVPSEETRKRPPHGLFFDPARSSQVPDYFAFYNDLVAEVLVEQVQATKQAVNRRKITGVFYGYLWANYPHLSLNHSGHLGFQKILDCPEIDFIASPYGYDNRGVGGANNSQTLPETITRYGKLFFNEADTETHLRQRQWRWGNSLRNPMNFLETEGLLVRDFAYAFTGGFGTWFMELLGGMYHDRAIVALLDKLLAIDQKYLDADKRAETEIAVVLDEASFTFHADGDTFLTTLLNAQKSYELVYLGAPFETIRLVDLVAERTPLYKFYIFLNTFQVSGTQRERIHHRLRENRATALWVYAPGYIDQTLSVAHMRELTGIHLAKSDAPGELRVELTHPDHPYTRSLPSGLAYGTDVNVEAIRRTFDHQLYLKDISKPDLPPLPGLQIRPRFYGDDREAIVLGKLVGLNQPGLLVKSQSGWTSIYSSAPILPAALLRNMARGAGGHIYSDANDVVYANRRFVAIYSPTGGHRVIRMPRPRRIYDVLTGRVLAAHEQQLSLSLIPNSTTLLGID